MNKPRVIKYFENLDDNTKSELLTLFPFGFDRNLITFKNHKGELISALPYENEHSFYMIKMTKIEAKEIYSDLEDMDFDLDDDSDVDDNEDEFENIDDIEDIVDESTLD